MESNEGADRGQDARSTRIPLNRVLIFLVIAIGGASFDLTTKAIVFEQVGPPPNSPPVPIIGEILELRTSYNPGALFGFGWNFPHSGLLFGMLSIVAGIFIVYWLFVLGNAVDRWQTISLSLIMAGAIGNCYDRLRLGHVRDFVRFHIDSIDFDFPIFNFADNMLVIGASLLVLQFLRAETTDSNAEGDQSTTDES